MKKARGRQHRLTQEDFGIIKQFAKGTVTGKMAKAIGTIISMTGNTVTRVSRFETWDDYMVWKDTFRQRQSSKRHSPQKETLAMLPPTEKKDTSGSMLVVCNELVKIRRLMETLIEVVQPTEDETPKKPGSWMPFRGGL